MTDDDFEAVCLGKLNPQMAFMQGKMKIKGNMAKATKFAPDLFPPPTEANIAKYQGAKLWVELTDFNIKIFLKIFIIFIT